MWIAQHCCLAVWELEKTEIKAPARLSVRGEPNFWVIHGHLLAAFLQVNGSGELSGSSSVRSLAPFTRALPSWVNHLPKSPLPDTVTLGLGLYISRHHQPHDLPNSNTRWQLWLWSASALHVITKGRLLPHLSKLSCHLFPTHTWSPLCYPHSPGLLQSSFPASCLSPLSMASPTEHVMHHHWWDGPKSH